MKIKKLGPVGLHIVLCGSSHSLFNQLISSLKELRFFALSSLKEISAEMIKRGEYYGAAENRGSHVIARLDILSPQVKASHLISLAQADSTIQIDQDFIYTQVKKISDGRRKVLEGVGKGMARIVTAYAT